MEQPITITNVLVILPSITRGFQPKNYHAPAYQIGRSPSLPFAADGLALGIGKENVGWDRPRQSIAYGHAASHEYRGGRLIPEPAREGTETPYDPSSGRLSPAARKEITAQLSVPITPNSLPSEARRQSISTLLPAGIMSAKLSALVLEEEEANRRQQQQFSESPAAGRPETILEAAQDVETPRTQRPFPLSRSTSTSTNTSPVLPQGVSPTGRPPRRSRSRPQTSAAALSGTSTTPAFGARSAKKSLALTPVLGEREVKRSRAAGSGKPGWEGEEMVSILREDGIQVSTLRTASQLSQYISQIHAFPMASGDNATDTASKTSAQVIMVPLSDSPTLPSLSLLLTQGTTPSAICFQQDLLDRARRTEADWLPSALYIISQAVHESRQRDSTTTRIHVIAYSANPALSKDVVERCVEAGAVGVLQPPYESRDTLERVRKLVADEERNSPARRTYDVFPLGRRESHGESPGHVLPSRTLSPGMENPREAVSPMTATPNANYHMPGTGADIPSPFISDLAARRRSVDTGGLSLALQRASRHIMSHESNNRSAAESTGHWRVGMFREARTATHSPTGDSDMEDRVKLRTDRSASVADIGSHVPLKAHDAIPEEQEEEMAVAELLSEMYRQTRVAIEIQMGDYDAFAAPISAEHREALIRSLASWEFKPHLLSDEDLFHCACLLFEAVLSIHGLSELGVGRDQLYRLLFAIRAIYHAPNPYHNYVHAVDVLQATYTFLAANGVAPPVTYLLETDREPWVRKEVEEEESEEHENARLALHGLLRPQDIFTVMIGAMGHDVGHPGLSNVFMKNAKTPLSQIYSDQSVLENMHCILVVQLLRKHGFGFLLTGSDRQAAETGQAVESNGASSSDSSPMVGLFPNILPATAEEQTFKRDVRPGAVGDWRGFKKLLYATVLSTDMSMHFDWLKRFKDLGKRARAGLCVDLTEEEEIVARTLLCQALIKCADISNPTRPIEVSEYWSTVLLDEWAVQASLERQLDLPISVVASADALIQAKGQIGFIDLFTLPLYEAAADVMPDLRYFADQCSANRALWQARYDTLKEVVGDPLPIARTPITERNMAEATSAEARYKMLFPLSIPASLLSEQSTSPEQAVDVDATSRTASIRSETPMRADTTSLEAASPLDSENSEALHKLRANSDARTLRAAYQSSFKRHSSHSHRHHQWTHSKAASTLRANGEK